MLLVSPSPKSQMLLQALILAVSQETQKPISHKNILIVSVINKLMQVYSVYTVNK